MEKLLTIQETSEILRLKVSTLYTKVEKKEIPHCVTINAQEEGGRLETERNLLPLSCG